METFDGQIGDAEDFYPDDTPGQKCTLYVSTPGMTDVELYDLSDLAPGLRATVTCETRGASEAWGVSSVDVIFDG